MNFACKYIDQKIPLRMPEVFSTYNIFITLILHYNFCFYYFHIKWTCYSRHSNICKLLIMLTKDLGKVCLLLSQSYWILFSMSFLFYCFPWQKKIRYPHLVYHTLLLSASEVFMCILSDFFGRLVWYSVALCSPRGAENPYVTNCSAWHGVRAWVHVAYLSS